uniref:Uncharacterized protein n=1 Tax=Arundo donax TaxID=35708 RepID=A0A0A9IDY7_ARUDO
MSSIVCATSMTTFGCPFSDRITVISFRTSSRDSSSWMITCFSAYCFAGLTRSRAAYTQENPPSAMASRTCTLTLPTSTVRPSRPVGCSLGINCFNLHMVIAQS